MASRGNSTSGSTGGRKREGEVRRSQVVTTYGPGAMVDLIDDAVLFWGLDHWRFGGGGGGGSAGAGGGAGQRVEDIEEPRLRDRLAPRLEPLGVKLAARGYFRSPPDGDAQDPSYWRAIKATVFPRWMVCQNPECRRLIRNDQLDYKGKRYVHPGCGKGAICVPVRFVAACKAGHLDEFPWRRFVHGAAGRDAREDGAQCTSTALYLDEGKTGDFSGVRVRCGCGVSRALVDAKIDAKMMPRCSGRRPWLGRLGDETCEHHLELLVRTASNTYFSVTESALSIPDPESELYDAVRRLWEFIGSATAQTLAVFRTIPKVQDGLGGWSDAAVLETIAQIKAGRKPMREEIRRAEYNRFTSEPVLSAGDLPAPERESHWARRLPAAAFTAPLPKGVGAVVLAYKLREVRVQLGFTRFSPLPRNLRGETGSAEGDVRMALLGLGTDWLPAVEVRGEGIFVCLDEAAVGEWEARPAVREWRDELKAGFDAWLASHPGATAEFPGVRFFMLHSLAHLLITQLSLECGYAASSIRERIYCSEAGLGEDRPMAAILLSTGTPGTEGTLGGLVDQGPRLGHHLEQALRRGALCSNDPVCAAHNPATDRSEAYLDGASCYACLFIAESSCEWFNRHLDRSLVVPVVGQPPERAFFWSGQERARTIELGSILADDGGRAEGERAEGERTEGEEASARPEIDLEGGEALLAGLEAAGVPAPAVGEELEGGVVGELVWREARVVVVDGAFVGAEDAALLEKAGWCVFVAPVEAAEVIGAMRARRG